jgi:hypothetical protein
MVKRRGEATPGMKDDGDGKNFAPLSAKLLK